MNQENALFYDLHIHSCLSPCGSEEMTPYNIVGMAALKGLDVIAVTDHNSCKNCPAVLKAAKEYGILALPGMELTTAEEVHVICLFAGLSEALDFDAYVYERILPISNQEEIFGRQEIYGLEDAPVGVEERLLLSATEISFEDVWGLVDSFGGVMIPAHIDKNSFSLLANLGFVPEDSQFTAAEIFDKTQLETIQRQNPYLRKCRILHNSDAHTLGQIKEADEVISVRERSASGVLRALTDLTSFL